MNTQIRGGLVEIARPPASEWQVRAEGEADFGPRVLCRHLSNCAEAEKALTWQVLSRISAATQGAGADEHTNSERLG